MSRLIGILGLVFVLAPPAAAGGPFRPMATPGEIARLSETPVRATALRPFSFDSRLFADAVRGIAVERPDEVGTPSTLLELPHPDGGLVLFRVIESPVMAPELAATFPEIRTFRGEGIDDPSASVRFDVSPRGFSAMVLSAFGAWYVDPWSRESPGFVASYHRRDALRDPESTFRCEGPAKRPGVEDSGFRSVRTEPGSVESPLLSVGATLRTYRLALSANGEYSIAVCGASPTKACVAAELVRAVNRVTGIYERELAVRMTLVANNDSIIYLNPSTDPFFDNNDGGAMLGENQSSVDATIGNANYDFGHVFSTGGGGVAYLGVVCTTGWKAGGVTGSGNPTGDAFWVDYVAHEMGHQFGGNHTFDSNVPYCGGNRVDSVAYEVGSGSTIMAYAGICGSENLQPHSDPYFHAASFDEIVAYITDTGPGQGGSCPVSTPTGNSPPTVSAGADYNIPARTPFALTGTAADPNGDVPTYCWEEMDLDAGSGTNGPPLVDNGSRPIFRSFNPTTSPTRTFPKLSNVLAGTTTYGEILPTTTRTLTFRLTVRDDRSGGGGVDFDTAVLHVTDTLAAFAVTAPSTAVSWAGGSTQTVSWDVAGTTAAPISCANVALTFSTDGGNTFPTTLLSSTPNDGTQAVSVPNLPTTTARIRVACVGNVFFAISRPSFTVTAGTGPIVTTVTPDSGTTAGGTAVTITGSGFVAGATVSIGGVSASPVVVGSATSLTAVTGAHLAGPVDVLVTNPGGATGGKVSGYTYAAGTTSVAFYTVTPCRIIDTRAVEGPLGAPILAASPAERIFTLAPACGVPADARALSANVTVTGGGAAGSLRLYPADSTLPTATTISFPAGKTKASNTMLLLSAAGGAGRVKVRNDSTAAVHLILDVNGYFR